MRRDYFLAIILFIAAIPVGIGIAVAPEYLHLKGLALTLTFWGAFVFSAILIVLALTVALRAEAKTPPKGHGLRMLAIVGMALCIFGFVGFAILFLVQQSSTKDEADDYAKRPFPYVEVITPAPDNDPASAMEDRRLIALVKNAPSLTNVEIYIFRNGQGQGTRFYFPVLYARGEQLLLLDGQGKPVAYTLAEGEHSAMITDLNGSYFEIIKIRAVDGRLKKTIEVHLRHVEKTN